MLSEFSMYYAQDQSNASFRVLNYLVQRMHANYQIPKQMFHIKKERFIQPLGPPRIERLLPGETGEDFKQNLHKCLSKYLQEMLKIDASSKVAQDLGITFSGLLIFDGFSSNQITLFTAPSTEEEEKKPKLQDTLPPPVEEKRKKGSTIRKKNTIKTNSKFSADDAN